MQLSEIKGLGKVRLKKLEEFGAISPLDLVNILPIKYLDMTKVSEVSSENVGREVLIQGIIKKNPTTQYFSGRFTTKAQIETDCKVVTAMWFNQPYMKNNIVMDKECRFYGKLTENKGKFFLLSPKFEDAEKSSNLMGIFSKYSSSIPISESVLKNAIRTVLPTLNISSILSEKIECEQGLPSLLDAYCECHFPKSVSAVENARRRIGLEKAVRAFIKKDKKQKYLSLKKENLYQYINELKLPFVLTKSQKIALSECVFDIERGGMNRLLQGDVGSGKSIIMFALAIIMAKVGEQTAMMCPTTTLAFQHFENFSKIARENGVTATLLSSTTSGKNEELERIRSGEVDVVIGTHSLISDSVKFSKLSLAIIDEQQKFGVKQREKLVGKGKNVNLLEGTATPIPRTLSLMLYGEKNISYIYLEHATKNISTHIITTSRLEALYQFMAEKLDKGEMAYVVCPKINYDLDEEKSGAIETYERIKKVFSKYRVGLLHGAMSAVEREKAVQSFSKNRFDILVSTSLIEVGIDNENASLMLIECAEYFGLSSLHQLRGRIGRRGQDSFCFVHPKNNTEKSVDRLRFFKTHLDGFEIADYDLQVRGSGELFGNKQHGDGEEQAFGLNFTDIMLASNIAKKISEKN